MRAGLVVVVALAGCGRVGFGDAADGDGDDADSVDANSVDAIVVDGSVDVEAIAAAGVDAVARRVEPAVAVAAA